jgi:hypothetical protein
MFTIAGDGKNDSGGSAAAIPDWQVWSACDLERYIVARNYYGNGNGDIVKATATGNDSSRPILTSSSDTTICAQVSSVIGNWEKALIECREGLRFDSAGQVSNVNIVLRSTCASQILQSYMSRGAPKPALFP